MLTALYIIIIPVIGLLCIIPESVSNSWERKGCTCPPPPPPPAEVCSPPFRFLRLQDTKCSSIDISPRKSGAPLVPPLKIGRLVMPLSAKIGVDTCQHSSLHLLFFFQPLNQPSKLYQDFLFSRIILGY